MKKIVCIFSYLLFIYLIANAQNEHYLITGTYTNGKSEGIYVFKFNSDDGSFKEISHVKTSNPSYVTVSPDERFVYAVHENAAGQAKGGEISAFSFDKKTGTLTHLNMQPTEGDHPCYVEIDKTGKWVFAGNYTSGSLSVLPVNNDGTLSTATIHVEHKGSGPNKSRQASPHVHCTKISPDNHFLFVPDLGIDKVMIYSFDGTTGKLSPADQPFSKLADGSGPRHFTFSPDGKHAYLVEELSGTVVAYDYNKGRLNLVQQVSTMTDGDTSFAGSADIHLSPDGKFLYASNRSTLNNIAIYKVKKKTGKLKMISHQSTLGNTPRNFNLDPSGEYLLVANQNSNQVVIFKRDRKTGLLTDSGKRIEVGNPVCLKWIAVN